MVDSRIAIVMYGADVGVLRMYMIEMVAKLVYGEFSLCPYQPDLARSITVYPGALVMR
jgi:hypothetical protein